MDRPRLRWLPVIVVVVTVLYTISVYPSLPERMVTHWGIDGRPNGWSPREFGAWLLPGIMAFMGLLFTILPSFDPKKSIDKLGSAYDLMVTAILGFQGVIQYVMLSIAQGRAIDINSVVYVSVGVLFCIMGFALPMKKSVGRFLWVTAGVLTVLSALTAPPAMVLIVLIVSSAVATLGSIIVR